MVCFWLASIYSLIRTQELYTWTLLFNRQPLDSTHIAHKALRKWDQGGQATLESSQVCLKFKTGMKNLRHWRKDANIASDDQLRKASKREQTASGGQLVNTGVKGPFFVPAEMPCSQQGLSTLEPLSLINIPSSYICCLPTSQESLYFFKKNCILWHTVMFKVFPAAVPSWLAQFIAVAIGILTWRVGSHLNPPGQCLECRFERLKGRKERAIPVIMRWSSGRPCSPLKGFGTARTTPFMRIFLNLEVNFPQCFCDWYGDVIPFPEETRGKLLMAGMQMSPRPRPWAVAVCHYRKCVSIKA